MNLLLDTNVFMYCLEDETIISRHARELIGNENNVVYLNAVSIWEIRIKQKINKIVKFPLDFYDRIPYLPYNILNITIEHANFTYDLPLIHRDPFDRLLIAQAKIENLTLVTRDTWIQEYDLPTIKA